MKPLYDWQRKALATWDKVLTSNDSRMTIAAVTGSGKTRVALEAIERWAAQHPDWQVTILVPRRHLLVQWRTGLTERGFNPGRVGGGSIKGWLNRPSPQINLVTLQSASRDRVKYLRPGSKHLLIIDECHNLRGEQYRKAGQLRADAVMGMSGTPHPDPEAEKVVSEVCGPIRVRYRYAEALRDGVIPPFVLRAVQVPLTNPEWLQYERLSRQIRQAMKQTDIGTKEERREALQRAKHLGMERKTLLNRCASRFELGLRILDHHAAVPTLLFHERTDDVDQLALQAAHLDPAVFHSNQPDADAQLKRFANRETNLLMSCLAITEGFNAPFVQVAVMLSGPNAPLRRIQTLGRCLRGDTDEPNIIYFLYVNATVDERGLRNLLATGDIPDHVVEHYRMDGDWMVPTVQEPVEKWELFDECDEPRKMKLDPIDQDNMVWYEDGPYDRGWVCRWCSTALHRDGTLETDWLDRDHLTPTENLPMVWLDSNPGGESHLVICECCNDVAPKCQGLACSCAAA